MNYLMKKIFLLLIVRIFKLTKKLVGVVAAYTSKLSASTIEIRPETSAQHRTESKAEDYFATKTTCVKKMQPSSKARESSENSKRNNNNGKFFTKIQNLLIKKTDTKTTPRGETQKHINTNNTKDPELKVLKGTLMKTISLHIKQTTSVEKKINHVDQQEQAGKQVTNKIKNENSSAEGKTSSTYQSESKSIKPKLSSKNSADIPCSPAIKLKQNTLDNRQAKPLQKKPFAENCGQGMASSKATEKAINVGSPTIRNSSAHKNPEYFEVQKVAVNNLVRSPTHRNAKSSFNMAKILSVIKEKASPGRTSASLLKEKGIRQAFPNK